MKNGGGLLNAASNSGICHKALLKNKQKTIFM
jgi:hypothetical protein